MALAVSIFQKVLVYRLQIFRAFSKHLEVVPITSSKSGDEDKLLYSHDKVISYLSFLYSVTKAFKGEVGSSVTYCQQRHFGLLADPIDY